MPNWMNPPETFVKRYAEASVQKTLTDTRIVASVGPRQSGKTTLARRIANDDGRAFVSLDNSQSRNFAQDEPSGFIRNFQSTVIDENQRAPDLILEITGSVDLFKGTVSPDSLAGRVETVELLPFSQAEVTGTAAPRFLKRAFACNFPTMDEMGPTPDLVATNPRRRLPDSTCPLQLPHDVLHGYVLMHEHWLNEMSPK